MAILLRNPELYRDPEIKFCAEKAMDILIEVPGIGLNIIFDSKQQVVQFIVPVPHDSTHSRQFPVNRSA